jgi:hypothetical protein
MTKKACNRVGIANMMRDKIKVRNVFKIRNMEKIIAAMTNAI